MCICALHHVLISYLVVNVLSAKESTWKSIGMYMSEKKTFNCNSTRYQYIGFKYTIVIKIVFIGIGARLF